MIGGVLLAAGGARRFGSQKLIATLEGLPVVRRAALALAPHVDEMLVVVGFDADAVRGALVGIPARAVENPAWSEGLSSSLRRGVDSLSANTDAALIALGDQPCVDASLFARLVEGWHATSRPIVAARYRGLVSPPVLFDSSIFSEVAELRGDVGARAIIQRDAERVAFVDVDDAPPRDIDTIDDLRAEQP